MTRRTIRIGTRNSQLALWQAQSVADKLENLGYNTEIISVKSEGDLLDEKPLYQLGITGVFTRTLDVAMIKGHIDIAVHSMKDVPTTLPEGIVQGAVLQRANVFDILVYKNTLDFLEQPQATIATGSLRRKAQWLNAYPTHQVVNLRGNVNTRLQKLADNPWNGAIFAFAGLDRLEKIPQNHLVLNWMTPAPAQGAILVVAMEKDSFVREALEQIHHQPTAICTDFERRFLKKLEGGCTAPIGAYAHIEKNTLHFVGNLFSLCGTQKIEVRKQIPLDNINTTPEDCALFVLHNGGASILKEITTGH